MTTEKTLSHEGKADVCAHRVKYSYWDIETELSDRLIRALDDEAESRAKELITEGCHSGELNCYFVDDNDEEHEIRGWWEIER